LGQGIFYVWGFLPERARGQEEENEKEVTSLLRRLFMGFYFL
jgi:hypothetical protein